MIHDSVETNIRIVRAIFKIRILFEYLDSKNALIYMNYLNILSYSHLFVFLFVQTCGTNNIRIRIRVKITIRFNIAQNQLNNLLNKII